MEHQMADMNISSHLRSASGLLRFIPEPKSRLASTFGNVLQGIGSAVSGVGSGLIDPTYQSLINKQIEVQQQLQLVSMESNIERSRHESKMAAVRNLRAS